MNQYSPAPLPDITGYSISHIVGSGGMGTVYAGKDGEGREVAVKVLHPGLAADPEVRARLRREVSTLHRVRGAQVSQVLDAELDASQAFIVTELIDGQDLTDSIDQHGPMDAAELANLGTGLASALRAIHDVGVVHRDLKPGNVMLTNDGPVLIDFGISQVMDDARLTRTGLVTGTPGYVDPVVITGANPDELGDWWGWAALLVFASTGRPPFGTGPLTAVLARAESGRVDVDGVAEPLAAVLKYALAPRPEDRLAPAQVIDTLSALATGEPVPPLPLPPAEPLPSSPPPSYPPNVPPTKVQHPMYTQPGQYPPVYPPSGVAHPVDPDARQDVVKSWPDLDAMAQPLPTLPPSSRPFVTLLWWIGAGALSYFRPGLTLIGFVAIMVIMAMFGSAGQGLRKRQNWYGKRRRDIALALVTSPIHLLLGALRSVPGIIVGALGAGLVWLLATQVVSTPLASAAACAFAIFAFWWTPTSSFAREGTRAVFGIGKARSSVVWAALAGVVIVAAAALIFVGTDITWDPLPTPPVVKLSDVS